MPGNWEWGPEKTKEWEKKSDEFFDSMNNLPQLEDIPSKSMYSMETNAPSDSRKYTNASIYASTASATGFSPGRKALARVPTASAARVSVGTKEGLHHNTTTKAVPTAEHTSHTSPDPTEKSPYMIIDPIYAPPRWASGKAVGGAIATEGEFNPSVRAASGEGTSKELPHDVMASPYKVSTGLPHAVMASPHRVSTGTMNALEKGVSGPVYINTASSAANLTPTPDDPDSAEEGEVPEPQRLKLTPTNPMPQGFVVPSASNQSISNPYHEDKRKWDETDSKDRPCTRPPQDPATMTAAQRLRYDHRMKKQAKIDKIDATHRNERDMRTEARKGTDPRSSNPPKDLATMTEAERTRYFERKDRKHGIPGVSDGSNKTRKKRQRKAAWEKKQKGQQS